MTYNGYPLIIERSVVYVRNQTGDFSGLRLMVLLTLVIVRSSLVSWL